MCDPCRRIKRSLVIRGDVPGLAQYYRFRSVPGHPIAGAERARSTAGAAKRPLIDRREGNTLQPLSYSK
jgi:hypothetical protein